MNSLEILQQGIEAQDLSIDDEYLPKLIEFVSILHKWNKVYNLTAVRDKNTMLTRHILDSLTLLPFIEVSHRIADLGSGGGLPGIPLAICYPDIHFTLIDSNSKKTRFLTHAIHTLNISNAKAVHSRIEDYFPDTLYDCLISRAFASPDVILSTASHLCDEQARLVLMTAHLNDLDLSGNNSFNAGISARVKVFNESSTRHVVTFIKEKN